MAGRHNGTVILKIRSRKPGKTFRTKLVVSKKDRKHFGSKVVGIRKVGQEELFSVGEYNPLPKQLMEEFSLKQGKPD